MATFEDFQALDIRVGTVVSAKIHPTARKPAYQLAIDFGNVGIRQSSAQLTKRYKPSDLVGRQVVAIVNFPPRRVADYTSDVLVLGAMASTADVVLLTPDQPVANGLRIE